MATLEEPSSTHQARNSTQLPRSRCRLLAGGPHVPPLAYGRMPYERTVPGTGRVSASWMRYRAGLAAWSAHAARRRPRAARFLKTVSERFRIRWYLQVHVFNTALPRQ